MRDREHYKKKEKKEAQSWRTWGDFKKKSLAPETKNNVLLNFYILIPSRGQMAHHPILLGAVQTYKVTDIPSSAQGMGMANSLLLNVYVISSLWNIFYFFILYKVSGRSLSKAWMHSTSSLPTAVSYTQITRIEGRTYLSAAGTLTVALTKILEWQEIQTASGMHCYCHHGALGLQFSF